MVYGVDAYSIFAFTFFRPPAGILTIMPGELTARANDIDTPTAPPNDKGKLNETPTDGPPVSST